MTTAAALALPDTGTPDSTQASPYTINRPLAWTGARRPAVIIAASDGTVRSDGALRVALARAEATHAALEIMTVARWELVGSAEGIALWQEESAQRRSAQRRAVEEQLERLTGVPRTYGVTVLDGHPAYTISRVAVERHAALVVVGLGAHSLSDRLFADETALQLARISRVPVLAVPEDGVRAPVYAVVAVDFGDLSDRAAQAAIEAVGDEGQVDLAHVMPHPRVDALGAEMEDPYESWARSRLADLMTRLVAPPGVRVSPVLLRGRPAHEILAYVGRVNADVIATGTHGRGFVARAVLGSVATTLIRGARCGVLSVPRDPLPGLEPRDRATVAECPPPEVWAQLLRTFATRNAGRRTILEVDDLELGAQAQEYNYPLLATSYDGRTGRVELVFGDARAGGRRLARSVGDVMAVDVLTDGRGQDVALRVQHGTSQTLLTFAAA
ncbi:MAG: putative universal stress protein [Gemmatimonadetes bacterium]|nr:putative universal stress protein [Gemmatimonadota bacterium]